MSKPPRQVKVESIRPRAVSITDAARYLGLAPKTLYNQLSRNAKKPLPIRVYRFGGKPLLDLADIDAYLDSLLVDGERREAAQ